jgi:hypothetical protein
MKKPTIVAVALLVLSLLAVGTTRAQQPGTAVVRQCLHGSGETAEQATRRIGALTATRTINNIQANRPEARNEIYLRQDQLAASPYAMRMKDYEGDVVKRISLVTTEDILPGWKLTLDVAEKGYWFMIRDMTDPCGYRFISNQDGVIFTAETLR